MLIKLGLFVACAYIVASLCWLPMVARLAPKAADAPLPAPHPACCGGSAKSGAARCEKIGPEHAKTFHREIDRWL